eukprot:10388639-Alexandrium_andersonii.AAC.1
MPDKQLQTSRMPFQNTAAKRAAVLNQSKGTRRDPRRRSRRRRRMLCDRVLDGAEQDVVVCAW